MKAMTINFQAFLKDVRYVQETDAERAAHLATGMKLDEIQITTTLTSRADVERLMEMLLCVQPCFGMAKPITPDKN